MDFSPVAIEVANAAPDSDQISYTVGDARMWTPAEPADLVVISFLHLLIDELVAVITASGTWLRPGGHLFYSGHALENLIYAGDVITVRTLREFMVDGEVLVSRGPTTPIPRRW